MSLFFRPLSRRWRRLLLALTLIGGTFLVFYVNAKEPHDLNAFDRVILTVSAPIQHVMTEGYLLGEHAWERYVALVDVQRKNQALREQVTLLEQRLNALRETELENQRLRKLLEFTRQQGRPFRTARVVGYDPTSHYRTLRIDRGSSEGIGLGMVVATSRGIVGRVLKVWAHYADVLLITDPQSGVDALIQRTRARGTVEGMGSAALRLKYLLRLDEVQQGDIVVTSGFDGVFPSGLLIGTVSGLRRRSTGVFQEVQIIPAVDLSQVEEVVVLENLPGPGGEPLLPPERRPPGAPEE